MDINISPNDLLAIIGEKEITIRALNNRVIQLENEIKRLKDLHEPPAKEVKENAKNSN